MKLKTIFNKMRHKKGAEAGGREDRAPMQRQPAGENSLVFSIVLVLSTFGVSGLAAIRLRRT